MKQAQFFYLLRRGFFGGTLNPTVRAFQTRVLADGGVVESLQCLNQAVSNSLPVDFGRYTFDIFSDRVTTDSGSVEARNCTIDSINSLN
jgi:hypothetical protein